jgi:hypothetical protein
LSQNSVLAALARLDAMREEFAAGHGRVLDQMDWVQNEIELFRQDLARERLGRAEPGQRDR